VADGAFYLNMGDGFIMAYEGVQNVVAKVARKGLSQRNRSVLVNCHFDTVTSSPGASDDGVSCGMALEAMRALTKGPPLDADVLFLFNGAEETPLAASHAFVTSHPLAKSVEVFYNMEAAGAGGKQILFQAGPSHSAWLLDKYLKHAPYPFATVVGQELFMVILKAAIKGSKSDYFLCRQELYPLTQTFESSETSEASLDWILLLSLMATFTTRPWTT